MSITKDFVIQQLPPSLQPSSQLIELLNNHFPQNITNQTSWKYYFQDTTLYPPWIQWIEFEHKAIAHHSLFFINFITPNGSIIKAGKPELPCVSNNFFKLCLKEKNNPKPMEIINKNMYHYADNNQIQMFFSFPNITALNMCQNNGYKLYKIKIN
ncbi:MAG: hypothetical protein KKA19_02020, partial [Candidatus Margulisbacteria bacterium]|nr:hypothetical protein [Candidatus Margulisiibacteriota bacterium]